MSGDFFYSVILFILNHWVGFLVLTDAIFFIFSPLILLWVGFFLPVKFFITKLFVYIKVNKNQNGKIN